ncbi:MAG: hypothetical protein EWV61_10665 [Microcystis aeruginosa Ma_AC_P_19900807_S300]|nr:MAG: hypothetical protein EWV61_10665 [Microcystis aeruginosa Ma_AC_P_19900807_S300]
MQIVELTQASSIGFDQNNRVLPKSFLLKYKNLFFLFSLLSILAFSIYAESVAIFACYILFAGIGTSLVIPLGRTGVKTFIIVYSISSVCAILFYYLFQFQYGAPYQGGGSDSLAYETFAAEIKDIVHIYDSETIGQTINEIYHNSKGYIYLISLLMRLSDLLDGYHPMIARLFNAALLGGCSVITYSIAKKISLSLKQAFDCAIVTGLFPIMIFVGVQTLRDIPIAFIMLLSVHFSISLIKSNGFFKSIFLILLFTPLVLVILEFRLTNAINIGIVLLAAISVKMFSIRNISNMQILFAVMCLYGLYNFLLRYDLPLFIDLIGRLDSSQSALSEGLDRAGEGGLSLILFNLPVPLNYFGSLFYSFITPLPIIYPDNIDWNFLSFGTIYQFVFIPFIFVGLKNTWRSGLMLPLLVMFLICFGGYVFGSFTFRHITYIVPFAAIYGVIGYEKYKKQRWVIWPSMFGVLVFLILAYYAIKL